MDDKIIQVTLELLQGKHPLTVHKSMEQALILIVTSNFRKQVPLWLCMQFTVPFNNKQTLKFKTEPTVSFFTAARADLLGTRDMFNSTVSKCHVSRL